MKTQQVDISTLANDPANVRKHDERNIATIKASLQRFGQQKPIVIDADGVVIAGNGTLEAARQLGWEKISVHRSDLKGSDRTAYAIADNRTAELATWDDAALAETLAALQCDESIDELVTGFSDSESDILQELYGETDSIAGGVSNGQREGKRTSRATFRAVVSAECLSVFEHALELTGEENRSDALAEIFRRYVEHQA